MRRPPHRRPALAWLGLLALLLAAPPARAGEDAPPPGVPWVDGWPAGRARAAAAAQGIAFVYVGREHPPCPPCRQLEAAVFARPEAAAIAELATPVRIHAGEDLDAAGRAFVAHYEVDAYPTMLALAPDGGLLGRSFPRDLAGILARLRNARRVQAAFLELVAAVGSSREPEDVRALAAAYRARMQWAEARRRYETLLATSPDVEDAVALLDVVTHQGDDDARATRLAQLVRTWPEDARHVDWRIAHAEHTARRGAADAQAGTRAARDAVAALRDAVEGAEAQAAVRLRLASLHDALGERAAASAARRWILAHAAATPAAPVALLAEARRAFDLGRATGDRARLAEAGQLLARLLADHPDHALAVEASLLRARLDLLRLRLDDGR